MGRLDEFFRSLGKKKKKRSELEILEDIEALIGIGDIGQAVELVGEIESESNRFLALRMILRSAMDRLAELRRSKNEASVNIEDVRETVKTLIPLINSIFNPRYRSILLGDLAVLLYHLNDELNGDMALRTSINLAGESSDIIRDVLMELIKEGLLKKAGYAMKMVRDPEKLDVVLVHLAEMFYREGDVQRAKLIIDHISSPFHKAMALYYLAEIEGNRNREKALKILEAAFKIADKVEDPDARFELMLKLYDLKYALLGKALTLEDILSRREAPPQ
ncbi:hypothetical protein [Thermococcus sp. MAR1]|uniref:hypothetical protein n=1 Tax=Thermococcus sp. MAR1 TaxID=1638263 RepID=UPI00143AD933|nr:hypothetical protein [Thermococcus sp. MAR1]NJE09930.1 hypothetical protein [Thermococcus sp. MAR1]